jgi:hypothetical protein
MNQNRARRGFAWDALSRAAAKRAGYQDAPYQLEGMSFLRKTGVSPFVQVIFRRVTASDTAPAAYLGVHVDEFEREWRGRLRLTAESGIGEFPPFALYSMNIEPIMERPWSPNSPSDQDVASVEAWLDRAFEYAKRLPSSLPALVTAIVANRIADHPLEFYLGHPVKVRGLVQWLLRVHDVDVRERVLPLLSDRTEPYDVNVMLGPG